MKIGQPLGEHSPPQSDEPLAVQERIDPGQARAVQDTWWEMLPEQAWQLPVEANPTSSGGRLTGQTLRQGASGRQGRWTVSMYVSLALTVLRRKEMDSSRAIPDRWHQ
ncbi:hypothetical protein [Streptomyces sp. NPDC052107]|uniref:hypothetical protein n=1 Tax=Streptomyces sp. NPDC052107 TaxID=3155632 RepID=UPI00341B650C